MGKWGEGGCYLVWCRGGLGERGFNLNKWWLELRLDVASNTE